MKKQSAGAVAQTIDRNEFLKLAERIEIKPSGLFMCTDMPNENAHFVKKLFAPVDDEQAKEYGHLTYAWGSVKEEDKIPDWKDRKESNNFRLTVLAFAYAISEKETAEDFQTILK